MAKEFSFEANDKKIEDVLFSLKRRFIVPRYQRPYAWNLEQITEFWNDLITNNEPYFLGSFVFCTENEEDENYVQIIDGQQRLLTITILMAVLRDHAITLNPKQADLYQRHDIYIEDRYGKESFRVIPDDLLKDYFETYIQSGKNNISVSIPQLPEEMRVKQNYEYFFEKVKEEIDRFSSNDDKLKQLDAIRKKVSRLIVINVEIEREEDAYEIFETTNARGLDLSVSDLLKNLVFKRIPAGKDRDVAKDIWQEITNNIYDTETELRKFIRYYWLSKYTSVTEKKLYRDIKNKITEWQTFLNNLKEASIDFNKLLVGNENDFMQYKNGNRIFNSLIALRIMNVTQCYVLFLSILRNYDKLKTDPSRIVEQVEKFTFAYSTVCNLPGNKVEKMYSKYAIMIDKACEGTLHRNQSAKIQNILSTLEGELKDNMPSYAIYSEPFMQLSYRNTEYNRRMIKYVLSKYDTNLRTTKENKIDFNNVNIEHILPQKPDSSWGLKAKDIKKYVNKLGNLTLLDKKINSVAQNKSIKDKLHDLEKSTLPITIEFVKHLKTLNNKWSEKHINNRQKELCEIGFNHIWRL
ncbi:MAG: DUF262 domain-containing HNH endonuclease family protein [Bacteroidota bacterium]